MTKEANMIRGLRSIPLEKAQRDLLVSRRHELGLSQQQVADMIGVMQVTIHNIEAGKHQPTPQMLTKLCEALNLEFDVSVYVYLRPKRSEDRGKRAKG
jgi:transcriptional regulator with XRE-family HTH domain